MKPTLPICIPSLPDTTTSPALWRQIAPILQAIAEREKRNEDLYPSERTAYNSLSFAQYQATKKQWLSLWQYLLDRQVLQIGDVAAPPPEKPKRDRPINPRKNKAAKVAKPKRKKKRKPRTLTYLAALRATLIRLRVFLWFCGFVAYSAPLCPRAKQGLPLRDRPRGERIKALLSYKTTGGFASLKVYMPSSKTRYKMETNVKRLLLDWCNERRETSEAQLKANRLKGLNNRLISPEQLNQSLSDKWRDTAVIAAKLTEIMGIKFTPTHVSKILSNRLRAGEVFQHSIGNHDVVYYSRIQATEFESEWITQEAAYQIALSRGCTAAKNTFRKHHRFDYSVYGLEFRENVPESENRFMRWRDIQS